MVTVIGWVILLAVFLGGYAYGVRVGHRAGVKNGRAQADAEWQWMSNHGAL